MASGKGGYAFWAALIVGAVLVVRVAGIWLSPVELYADEAQYWRWGQTLDWGYYSKPPLIAWVIRAATEVFGSSEAAIRTAAPFLQAGASLLLFALARDIWGPRAGLYAALLFTLMPGGVLSAAIISTDGVLMPIFAASLWALWRLRERPSVRGAVLLGVLAGAGYYAKYAMIYFAIGVAAAVLLDAPTRRALAGWRGAAAFGAAALVLAPHLIWSVASGFETVSHTVDNADLQDGAAFQPEGVSTFLENQAAIFGPVSLLALLALLCRWARGGGAGAEGGEGLLVLDREAQRQRVRWLLCFILPVLGVILVQSVISRAHANWAATAYPAATVLLAGWATRLRPSNALWSVLALSAFVLAAALLGWGFTGLGVGMLLAGGLLIAAPKARFASGILLWFILAFHGAFAAVFLVVGIAGEPAIRALGLDNAFKRAEGWEETAAEVFAAAERVGASAILVDEREVWHGLDYYLPQGARPDLIAWRLFDAPKSFSEKEPLQLAPGERVLVASLRAPLRPMIAGDFERFERAGLVEVPLGRRGNGCPLVRRLVLYEAQGHAPPPRTRQWREGFEGRELDRGPDCRERLEAEGSPPVP